MGNGAFNAGGEDLAEVLMSFRVVTVSREFGSGGKAFGRALADRLSWDYVDSRLVNEIAKRMHCSREVVEQWDERGEGIILRILRALQGAHPEAVVPGPVGPAMIGVDPSPERVAAVVRQIVQEEARRGNAVIVGRGGAWILAKEPGVMHIRLVAERADRIARIADRLSAPPEETAKLVEQTDRERSAYLKHHFGSEWHDPHNFHLTISTSLVAVERAALLVEQLIRAEAH